MAEIVSSEHGFCPDNGPNLSAAQFQPAFRAKVGEDIGAKWKFPSDHIPVAASICGLRLASWNVLNTKWVHYFAENKEGLANSSIMAQNAALFTGSSWTRREEHTLHIALDLAANLDLLLLQECSQAFLERLAGLLPFRAKVLRGRNDFPENDIAAIYNSSRLTLSESLMEPDGYPCKPGKAIMNLVFALPSGAAIRVLHTHVPGDPAMPGLAELASYAARAMSGGDKTIIAGDLNFTLDEVRAALKPFGLLPCISLSAGNTNIGNNRLTKGIDHIIVFNETEENCVSIRAEDLSCEIAAASRLINPAK